MKKEGKVNYDSGNIARILIISILIVLILIVGNLIYVTLGRNKEPANNSKNAFIIENSVCRSPQECTELAVQEKNMSVCDYIERSSPLPYTYAGCFNKVAKELNGK